MNKWQMQYKWHINNDCKIKCQGNYKGKVDLLLLLEKELLVAINQVSSDYTSVES